MTEIAADDVALNWTYKLRPETYDHALYFTIVGDPVRGLFVNSKQMESYQWISALMTSYVDQLKSGVSIHQIAQRMSEAFDPRGGYIVPKSGGVKVNSVIHHIGYILERHFETHKSEI